MTIGLKGAIRITSDLEGSGVSESRPYLVGPMVEVRLPYRFAFEADALYGRFGYSSTTGDILGGQLTDRVRANSWEFPLLVKYRLQGHSARPYALLGYAPRHTSGTHVRSGYLADFYTGLRSPFQDAGAVSYHNDHALVVGAGIEWAAGRLRISPEVRYLRWKNPLFFDYGSHGYYLLVPQNDVQVLVGIGWGGR